jgi:curved DNA-binding protein CbpA
MKKQTKSYYQELGVSPDATEEEIRAAFRRRAKSAHPDRPGGSHEGMAAANRAAEVLLNPRRRLTYDRTGEDKPTDTETKAREKIVSTILNWMANPENDLDSRQDPMSSITKILLSEQRAIDITLTQGKQLVRRLRKHLKKLKFRGKGKPIIIQMIEYQIRQVENSTGQTDDNLEILKLAIQLSRDIHYEQEPSPAGLQSSGLFTGNYHP